MIQLPKLAFEKNALEPYISAETLDFHYWKHHQAYVDNTNNLIAWTDLENESLENIIKVAKWWLYNNSAQVWNHSFYWNCLSPNYTKTLSWEIEKFIEKDFWSFENFKKEFSAKAVWNFASGWTWLALNWENKLEIINTDDAETLALSKKYIPLLVIDVWEHAYYIDVRNARPKYIENFWNLVNWDFVNENLKNS